jgi:hypothetical protein
MTPDAGDHGGDDHETEVGDGEPGFFACGQQGSSVII